MRFRNAYIPLQGAWSSPFARWQGPAELSSLDLAAPVTERALRERGTGRATALPSSTVCRRARRYARE